MYQLEWILQLIQTNSLGIIKLSFVFFFRRIFNTGNKNGIFSIVSTSMIILIVLWTISFFFSFLFACRGHFTNWWTTPLDQDDFCIPPGIFEEGFALSDVIMDFLIVLMPIPMVSRHFFVLLSTFKVMD